MPKYIVAITFFVEIEAEDENKAEESAKLDYVMTESKDEIIKYHDWWSYDEVEVVQS